MEEVFAEETLLPVVRKWLKITGHLSRPSARSSAAIRLAFAAMEQDGLPTTQDLNLMDLRVYVRRALGPRTLDSDPDLYGHPGSPPPLPPDSPNR